MTTELLERLSKAAPEFIQDTGCGMFRIGILEFGESKSGRLVEVINGGARDVEWQLFGAICEKIETEGWLWSIVRGTCEDYTFRIYAPPSVQIGDPSISDESWQAAALALCKALEAKQESVENSLLSEQSLARDWDDDECWNCNGRGNVPLSSLDEYASGSFKDVDCPECDGTGKQQEVTK